MSHVRKILGLLFAVLGAYYGVLSVLTIVRLPAVTTRWVQASGDPDFKYDYSLFMGLIAIGAILFSAFGARTAVKGFAAARGRRESWLALALGAPILHTFWLLFRIIGTGQLDRDAQATAIRSDEIRFTVICVAYFVMWILMRTKRAPGSPRLEPELTTN